MFQWKNLFIRTFLLKWKSLKHLWEDAERLAEELQKYPCFYEKGNKGYKEKDWKENALRAVKQFLIGLLWTIRDQSILWKVVHFSSLLSLKTSLLIWNTIFYHWHASPAINYGKLFCSLLYLNISRTHVYFLFLLICSWWYSKRKQQDPNSTFSPDESILRIFYNFLSCTY